MPRVAGSKNVQSKRTYKGKGAYTLENGPWANRGASLGGAVAKAYGVPSAIGSWIGRRAFHYPARLFGSGAYSKKSGRVYKGRGDYSLIDQSHLSPQVPRFEKGVNEDGTVISHREYIGDIITSSSANTFNVDSFNINPGDPKTFPWLSSVAQTSYQQYEFMGCIFEYVSTSANALNSTNTALGVVTSCVNYDSSDPEFSSRMQMENTNWANSSKPSMNMSIPVECAKNQTTIPLLYVSQNGVLPSDADPKMYYLGKLYVATSGFQGTSVNIGSLYVTYKVRLLKPFMPRPLANANRALYVRSGVTSANPMGTATVSATSAQCDTLGITFSTSSFTISKNRLQVNQRYIVIFEWNHDSGVTTTPSLAYTPAGAILASYQVFGSPTPNSSGIYAPKPSGTTVTASCVVNFMEITQDTANIVCTLSAATFPANASLNISIYQICGTPSATLGLIS